MEQNFEFVTAPDDVTLEYRYSKSSEPKIPHAIVFVPGMLGTVSAFNNRVEEMLFKEAITFSHRGCGKSANAPTGHYSFDWRLKDVEAAASKLSSEKFVVYGFSRGAALAVAYAKQNPKKVTSLILGDCAPTYKKTSEKWRDSVLANAVPELLSAEAANGFHDDSSEVDMLRAFEELALPTLLIKGEKEGSLLTEEDITTLVALNPKTKVLRLPNSAHGVENKDRDLVTKAFIKFFNGEEPDL